MQLRYVDARQVNKAVNFAVIVGVDTSSIDSELYGGDMILCSIQNSGFIKVTGDFLRNHRALLRQSFPLRRTAWGQWDTYSH